MWVERDVGLCCGLLWAQIMSKYLIHNNQSFFLPAREGTFVLVLEYISYFVCHLFLKPWDTNHPFCLLDFQDPHLSIMRHPLTHQASPRHRRLTQVLGPLPLSPSWAVSSTPCRSTATVTVPWHSPFRGPSGALCGVEDGHHWLPSARQPLSYAPVFGVSSFWR